MKDTQNKYRKTILFITIFATLIFFARCTEDSSPDAGILEYVIACSDEHPEGFTVNIRTFNPVTDGIAVAYFETQNRSGRESLPFVIEHALQHESVVGGWLDTRDSIYYYDSDRIFPDTALNAAIAFAVENRQYAVYHLGLDSLIIVPDSLK